MTFLRRQCSLRLFQSACATRTTEYRFCTNATTPSGFKGKSSRVVNREYLDCCRMKCASDFPNIGEVRGVLYRVWDDERIREVASSQSTSLWAAIEKELLVSCRFGTVSRPVLGAFTGDYRPPFSESSKQRNICIYPQYWGCRRVTIDLYSPTLGGFGSTMACLHRATSLPGAERAIPEHGIAAAPGGTR